MRAREADSSATNQTLRYWLSVLTTELELADQKS
jgi:hypothetical protein